MPRDFFTTKIRIVESMQKAEKPLILQHIAKLSRLTPQLVSYHMQQMVKWGIAGTVSSPDAYDDKVYYVLQQAYYDENWLNSLFVLIEPYIKGIANQIDFDQAEVEPARAVVKNLAMFLRLFQHKIEKMKL